MALEADGRAGDSVDVRMASSADVIDLAELRRDWAAEQGAATEDGGFTERFDAWFVREAAHRVSWLAEDGGTLVGMVNLAIFERMPKPGQEPSRWGYLANAYVTAAYRNRGVGGKLMDALLAYVDEQEIVRVVLSPSERSVPFYRRHGFGAADMLMARIPGVQA